MRNKVLKSLGLTLVAVSFLVGAAERASATAVNLFDSALNNGTTGADLSFTAAVGSHTVNLWGTPSIDVYSMAAMTLKATGGITIGAGASGFVCFSALCTEGLTNAALTQVQFSMDDATAGFLTGVPVHMATLILDFTAAPGTFSLTGGAGTNFDFGDINIDSDGILSTTQVPEPGTLLLLVTGLAGLAVQGRHRES